VSASPVSRLSNKEIHFLKGEKHCPWIKGEKKKLGVTFFTTLLARVPLHKLKPT